MEISFRDREARGTAANARIFEAYVRFYPRTPLAGPALLLDQYATPSDASILDISSGGMGLVSSSPRVPGQPCAIVFDVLIDRSPRRIHVWAGIAHCSRCGDGRYRIGVRFLDTDG